MTSHDELTPSERDALRQLSANTPADSAQEELAVARLKHEGLLGAVRPRTTIRHPARIAMAAAAAILLYLAGVMSGRAMRPGAAANHPPTANTPAHDANTQGGTLAAGNSAAPPIVIRF
jgi:hypothetical protein